MGYIQRLSSPSSLGQLRVASSSQRQGVSVPNAHLRSSIRHFAREVTRRMLNLAPTVWRLHGSGAEFQFVLLKGSDLYSSGSRVTHGCCSGAYWQSLQSLWRASQHACGTSDPSTTKPTQQLQKGGDNQVHQQG